MPRYHFNVYDAASLPDTAERILSMFMLRAAFDLAGSLIKEIKTTADLGDDWRLEVTDYRGLLLLRMDFMVT